MVRHQDGHGLLLVVAQHHFVAAAEALPQVHVIGLGLLALDVKGVAQQQPHHLVLGRVVNRVLAHELRHALAVALEHAHAPGGQRDADVVLLRVLELDAHLHLVAAPVGIVGVDLGRGDVGAFQQRNLLVLVVVDGGAPLQRVEVVLKEGLLGEAARAVARHVRLGEHLAGHRPGRRRAVDVAGDELQPCVLVGRAAGVVHRHPSFQVGQLLAVGEHHHVIGVPRQAGGEVAHFALGGEGLGRIHLPLQRRLQQQSARQAGQLQVAGRIEQHLAARVNDDAVADRQQRAARALAVVVDDGDGGADVLLQQLGAADQVVVVVLLQQRDRAGERLEVHAGGVNRAGHAGEGEEVQPLGEAELARLLHQRQVLVVDRQRDVIHPADLGGARNDACGAENQQNAHRLDNSFHRFPPWRM